MSAAGDSHIKLIYWLWSTDFYNLEQKISYKLSVRTCKLHMYNTRVATCAPARKSQLTQATHKTVGTILLAIARSPSLATHARILHRVVTPAAYPPKMGHPVAEMRVRPRSIRFLLLVRRLRRLLLPALVRPLRARSIGPPGVPRVERLLRGVRLLRSNRSGPRRPIRAAAGVNTVVSSFSRRSPACAARAS